MAKIIYKSYLIKDLYLEYLRNVYSLPIKRQSNVKTGKGNNEPKRESSLRPPDSETPGKAPRHLCFQGPPGEAVSPSKGEIRFQWVLTEPESENWKVPQETGGNFYHTKLPKGTGCCLFLICQWTEEALFSRVLQHKNFHFKKVTLL